MKKFLIFFLLLFLFTGCVKEIKHVKEQTPKKKYYMLRQVDKDGTQHYSKIIVIERNK